MTKRLNSKHKVDRRLKVNLWGRPKSPFNTRAYGPGQHGQTKKENHQIMEFNYKLNKN
jgi:small subunit ribosomal protein S4